MDARKYLESLAEAQDRIRVNQERVQKLHENLTSLSAPMDKEQVFHTKNVSIMADTVARIIDMEHEIDQQTERLYCLRAEAIRFFDQLSPSNSQLLYHRYIDGLSIADLSARNAYSKRSIYRALTAAIEDLQNLFNKLAQLDAV